MSPTHTDSADRSRLRVNTPAPEVMEVASQTTPKDACQRSSSPTKGTVVGYSWRFMVPDAPSVLGHPLCTAQPGANMGVLWTACIHSQPSHQHGPRWHPHGRSQTVSLQHQLPSQCYPDWSLHRRPLALEALAPGHPSTHPPSLQSTHQNNQAHAVPKGCSYTRPHLQYQERQSFHLPIKACTESQTK